MIYVLLAAFLIGASGGGFGVWWVKDAQQAKAERAQMQAEAQVAVLKTKLTEEQQNHIDDMQTAYESGQSQAKVIYRTITAKGHANAQTDPALVNPVCMLQPDSLRLLNAARDNDLRPASYSAGTPAAVPETAGTDGRANGNDVRGDAAGRGDVLRMQGEQGSTSGGGQVSGRVLPPPKPKPIK